MQLLLLCWCFTALQHFQGPFLNQRKGENGHRNYFMTNLYERMLPDVPHRRFVLVHGIPCKIKSILHMYWCGTRKFHQRSGIILIYKFAVWMHLWVKSFTRNEELVMFFHIIWDLGKSPLSKREVRMFENWCALVLPNGQGINIRPFVLFILPQSVNTPL